MKAEAACPAFGTARVRDRVGNVTSRPVRLYHKVPAWWPRGTVEQREAWLRKYFSRAATLNPGERLESVEVRV